MEKGCVYFFKHKGLSPIKIGYSSNESPSGRFDQFKTYAPFGAIIVGFIVTKDPKHLESKLHRQFSSLRLRGEWFEITDDLVSSLVKLYSSDEQKEINQRVQKKMSEIYQKKEDKTSMYSEYIGMLSVDFRHYNSETCDSFNEYYDLKFSNRQMLREIKIHCENKSLDFRQGRDSFGRFFELGQFNNAINNEKAQEIYNNLEYEKEYDAIELVDLFSSVWKPTTMNNRKLNNIALFTKVRHGVYKKTN